MILEKEHKHISVSMENGKQKITELGTMKSITEMKKGYQYILQDNMYGDKLIFSSPDGCSMQMLWNNITGKNFQGKEYESYLDMMKMTAGLPSGYVQLYLKPGVMSEEFCIPDSKKMDVYKQETINQGRSIMFKEAVKYSDIFIEDPKGKHSYGLPNRANLTDTALKIATSWHCVQWGHSYYLEAIDWKDGFTAIFLKADQIIASTLFAIVETSSVPKSKDEQEEETEAVKSTPEKSKNSEKLTAMKVFSMCTITHDHIVKLPAIKLDRKIYEEVKSIIDKNGGHWKGGKTQGFQFGFDPTELFYKLQGGEKVNNKKTFQFFATDEREVDDMIEEADIKKTDVVLEPSAGQGAIVDKVLPLCKKVYMCELMPENRQILEQKGYDIECEDFTKLSLTLKFDKIIANPPFTKNQDIDHVKKMYEHLKPNGRLVSIMSTSWQQGTQKKQVEFKAWLKEVGAKVTNIEAGAFKKSGTNIKTVMVVIDKK